MALPGSPMRRRCLRELRDIRIGRGMSQADLSGKTGVSEFTISELEAGKRPNPRPSTLRKLAQGLDVEVTDLLGGPELPKAPGPARQPEHEEPAGPADEERRPGTHPDENWTNVLEGMSASWEMQLERGLYDYDSARQMEGASFELWMSYRIYHRARVVARCRDESPGRLADLRAAEQRIRDVRRRLWDAIEAAAVEEGKRRGEVADLTPLRAEREAQNQQISDATG